MSARLKRAEEFLGVGTLTGIAEADHHQVAFRFGRNPYLTGQPSSARKLLRRFTKTWSRLW
jgi:hypothetical protein